MKKTTYLSFIFLLMLAFLPLHLSSVDAAGSTLKGIALKSPTNVYSSAKTSASVLKSYAQGTELKYRAGSQSGWYETSVTINGKSHPGYIRAKDVETPVSSPKTLKGIGIQNPTAIYQKASKESKKLKTYAQGTLLTYKTYITGWYQATFFVNKKAQTGYISASDVEVPVSSPETQKGISLESPTSIYAKPSAAAKVIKTYAQGSVLIYDTYISGWKQASVYISGKKTTGYIKAASVSELLDKQVTKKGITLSKMNVYAKAGQSAKVLKSYAAGSVLIYKTFADGWHEATVLINGKKTTGYIKAAKFESVWSTQQSLKGVGLKSPTKVYSKASTSSAALKSYKVQSVLKYKTLSDNWFETSVIINGVKKTGYIYAKDVRGLSYYDLTLDQATAMQMKVDPQTDSSGSWKTATSAQVQYYLDPSNFLQTSSSFYQFLDLSSVAGTSASEVNSSILKGKGILEGKASSFLSAAKVNGINEIYLISHALLETGNGTSQLAKGTVVDKVDGKAVTKKTVYNMYGIGAVDSCPNTCGAEYAYKAGWFTPEAAITGGASFIGDGYINAGQNTLYKMRWNPEKMVANGKATHQYASDIGWAVKQTTRISQMYGLLLSYTLNLEVPNYLEK